MHRLLNLAIEERDRMRSENDTLRARLNSAWGLLRRTCSVDLDHPSPSLDTIQEDICTWLDEDGEE